MSENPWGEAGRISVTFKQDTRDGTWIVVHGTPVEVRAQIVSIFGLGDEAADMPLYDLINEATRLYKASGNVTSGLGGRTIPKSESTQAPSGSAWQKVAEEPKVDPNVLRLQAAIESATSTDALKQMYARDVEVFQANPELTQAWQAKGKSLM